MAVGRNVVAWGLMLAGLAACRTVKSSALNEAAPSGGDAAGTSGPVFADSTVMNVAELRRNAFERCQAPQFVRPNPPPVKDLDPPQFNQYGEVRYLPTGEVAVPDATGKFPEGAAKGPGLDYNEEGLIQPGHDLYAAQEFAFLSRPRAALNQLPVQLFVRKGDGETYERLTWEGAAFSYTNPGIQAPIDASQLPAAGRVLTKLLVAHKAPDGGFPQIFDYGSTGYLRFQGYPQVPGASFRSAGAHNVFGNEYLNPATGKPTPGEDFGLLEAIFFTVQDGKTAGLLALIEGDLFCGALDIKLTPGDEAVADVDSYWYTRRDFRWQEEPNTGFAAYSSMYYQGYNPSGDGHHDEHTDAAHDSDTLIVRYKDQSTSVTKIKVPADNSRLYNAPGKSQGTFVIGLFPAFSAGRFKAGDQVEIWSGVAAGEPRTSDGQQKSWEVVEVNPAVGTVSLKGDNTEASTIGGQDLIFVQGHRLAVTDVSKGKEVQAFYLENADRDPDHYQYFRQALKGSSYEYRSSYAVEILESNVETGVRLVEHAPDREFLDNLVAFSVLRQDLPKAKTPEQFAHFHYKTWSCYPGSATCPAPK